MEKINIAEILKDCPKGMELDCTMYNKLTLLSVDDREDIIFPIRVIREDGNTIALTKYGQYADTDFAKCIIFPKGKTTWKGFQRPFKDGDIVFYNNTIAIFKEWGDPTLFRTYCVFYTTVSNPIYQFEISRPLFGKGIRNEVRLATEEEKQKLFDAIKDNGYKWNEETKTLEKLIELKFKAGDIISIYISGNYWYGIYQKESNNIIYCYASYSAASKNLYCFLHYGTCLIDEVSEIRLATEEEKQKLFRAIKGEGYAWNPETMTLEKLIKPKFKAGDRIRHIVGREEFATVVSVEELHYNLDSKVGTSSFSISLQHEWELAPSKFDITTLKPFQKVLVKYRATSIWRASLFSNTFNDSRYPFDTVSGSFTYCIPYEGNEHLLGTTDDCDDYYKTWEE